jgi:hypothetical protein
MNSNKTLEGLKGIWQTQDEDSSAIIEISEKCGKPHVSVFDKFDGEKFKVTKVRLESGALSFEAYVPSTKYRTKHKLRLKSKNIIEQELTLIEKWARIIEGDANE